MRKNNKAINTLIKQKGLRELMKNGGIKRVEEGVFSLIEKSLSDEVRLLAEKFKEGLEINGSRVLTREIARRVIED